MTTTNVTSQIAAVNPDGLISGVADSRAGALIDPALLAAMVNEYFPEFGVVPAPRTVSVPDLPELKFISGSGLLPAVGCEATLKAKGDYAQVGPQVLFEPLVLPDVAALPVTAPSLGAAAEYFDVAAIRKDFPILAEKVNGKRLVWFDNAATTQKPNSVIERLSYFYQHENSNAHRGAHTLAARATEAYEGARATVGRFLQAASAREIVFTRGTTEAINLVAQSWGKYQLHQDDEVVVSHLEHHANIVPWQMICAATGAKLRVIPVDQMGQVLLDQYYKLLGPKTKIVAVTQVSNALGTIVPVAEITRMAHQYGALVLIDGAQAVAHLPVNVRTLDCDFYVFSGHKIFGPTGIGVLYGKTAVLNAMRPYQGGGNMIADVTFERTVYQAPPHRFEAGTGNIAAAVGLGAALDYVNALGIDNINRYEQQLLAYATQALRQISGLTLIGAAPEKAGVLSFVLDGWTPEEVGRRLDREGIAVRAGHHCAQPILRHYGLEGTVRPSLAFYNTYQEVDFLVAALRELCGKRRNVKG